MILTLALISMSSSSIKPPNERSPAEFAMGSAVVAEIILAQPCVTTIASPIKIAQA